MPILSNTPTIRYITIQNLVIKDSNVYYPIATTETSRKYIYWDKDSPYELICEDEMLEDRANLYLLVINKKGNFTIVNQDSISVNFGNDVNLDGFSGKLNATIEKVDEHTKKFMSVTEDINGINKTVGTITEDLNETNEKLTNYKQTADQIAIDLQNTNKKYNDDKEFNKLRESIVSLLIDENTLLMGLNSSIKDITRDNNFTEEEKSKIKDTQSEITNKNDLLIIEVEKLVSMLEKEGLTDKKNQLTSIKEEYSNSFSLLNSTLTSLISGNLITPTQITTLINCISNVSTKLTKLKNICDEIIFLGTGGTLYEEIVKINITAGGIYSKISSIEENIKSNLSLEKGILNQHVKDLQTTVDKIETIIKEIYIDGLVNQNEKDLVSQNLELVENEHNDLINKYNEYLSNEYLSQEMKAKLQGIYSDYVSGYDTFVNELNTVISDGFFNESEKISVDLKLEDYRKNIIILHNNLSLAIDNYEENRYKSEIEAQKNQLQGEINEVKKDLTDLNDNIEGTFKNNIIDESERNAMKQNIKNLDIQKANIDSQYSQLYKNALLIDPLKTQFLNVYTNFNSSYDTLLATLNEILNKDTLITQQDKINMDKCYADLVLKTTEYTTIVNQVVEFIANAEAEQSKASFQDEINDLQQQIDGIDLNIDGAFADGILSEAEKISLKNNLDMLKIEKVDVDNQYKQTYSNSNLSSSNKSNLKTAYDNYIIAYNALVKFIETLINGDENINDNHKTQLETLLKAHNDKLALYILQYNLAIENISKSYTDAAKNTLQQQIKGVSDSISDLETDMNGVFQDSILTEAEKLSIKERLQNLQVEKINIDNQYNTLIGNVDLIDKDSSNTPKTNLKNSYNNLITSYTKLVNAINTFLNIQGILDETHRKPVSDAFTDYKTKLGIYSTRVNEAIDAISKKRVEDESNTRKEQYAQINQTVSEISIKVASVEKTANTTDKKVAEISTSLDGIAQKVSTVEQNQTTTDNKVTNLESWKKEAEQKITETAITSTVKKNFYTKSETDSQITSKGYQTASQVQQTAENIKSEVNLELKNNYATKSLVTQTANDIRYEFKEYASFPNLMPNGCPSPKNYLETGWTSQNAVIYAGYENLGFYVYDGQAGEAFIYSPYVNVTSDTNYSIAFALKNEHNMSSYDVYVEEISYDGKVSYTDLVWHEKSTNVWKTYYFNHTTLSSTVKIRLRFDNNGMADTNIGTQDLLQIKNAMVMLGSNLRPTQWYPRSEEINGDDIIMSKNGIISKHVNGSYTQMSSRGLEHWENGMAKPYHYMFDCIIVDCNGKCNGTWFTVQLPSVWKGKDFTVAWQAGNHSAPYGRVVSGIEVNCRNKNITNATVEVCMTVYTKGEWAGSSLADINAYGWCKLFLIY